MVDHRIGCRGGCCTASLAGTAAVGPADGVSVPGRAALAGDSADDAAAPSGDVAEDRVGAGSQVPLIVVSVAAEGDLHAVFRENGLKGLLQVNVAVLGRVVRPQRVVKERELDSTGMRLQVTGKPLVLS